MHAYFLQFQVCYYFPSILYLVSLIFYSFILLPNFALIATISFILFYIVFLTFVYSSSSNFLYTPVLLLCPGSCDCSSLSPMAVLSCHLWLFYLATCNIDYFISTHIFIIIHTLYSFIVFCLVTFTYFHTAIFLHVNTFISSCILITLFIFKFFTYLCPFPLGLLIHQ